MVAVAVVIVLAAVAVVAHTDFLEYSSLSLSPFLLLRASSHNEGLAIGMMSYEKRG